jgi:secretion/DNA translocation related TadE-like protein
VLVVAMAGVLMFVALALTAVGGLVTAQRRAQAAADLTALAAAAGSGGCADAGRIAAANGAAMDSCRVEGDAVRVSVSVPGPPLPGRRVRVSAEARAGPG